MFKYGKDLVAQFESKTKFPSKKFSLGRLIRCNFDRLSCLELITLKHAFDSVGGFDSDEPIDFPLRFFRHGEFNIARQLRLIMLEALKNGTINDHLHAYRGKYSVYGYLYYTPHADNLYTFFISEFDVNDSVVLTQNEYTNLNKFIRKKIVNFRKLCTNVGINNMELARHLYLNNDEIYSILVNDGFVNTRHGMIWTKR